MKKQYFFVFWQSTNSGFVLLIALEHEVTKSFQFDGRSFFEAKVKFTGGSFGRGVSSMRTHKFNNEEMIGKLFSVFVLASTF